MNPDSSTVPTTTEKKPILSGIIFALVWVFVLLVVLLSIPVVVIFLSKKDDTEAGKTNTGKVTGVLWTSGLSTEEKQNLEIPNVEFQIVFSEDDKLKHNLDGFFLDIDRMGSVEARKFLGYCVNVGYTVLPGWENISGGMLKNDYYLTYNRSAARLENIVIVSKEKCASPVQEFPHYDTANLVTLKGRLEFGERPAPDIAADYIFVADEPIEDDITADVYGVTNRVSATFADSLKPDVAGYVGMDISVTGILQWGYGETRVLYVTEVSRE